MAYSSLIVIFTAFAKKNADEIGFEKREEIRTLGPLLSFSQRIMKKLIVIPILSLVML